MTRATDPRRHMNHQAAQGGELAPADLNAGLWYFPGFLDGSQAARALERIDVAENEWNAQISRRTQHYGWRYDYRAKAVTPDMRLGRLPDWLMEIAERLAKLETPEGQRLFSRVPTQCIVNEYVGAQGIAQHTDHKGFGPAIATVSLLESWEMDLKRRYRDQSSRAALLQAGSALIMTGESRSAWSHGITPRKAEPGGVLRGRRLSLTFRTVLNLDNEND